MKSMVISGAVERFFSIIDNINEANVEMDLELGPG